jgi:hypothetical protein
MSFRMHQTPEITVTPVIPDPKPRASQPDVTELQTQLIKLQNQVTQLQAAQKTQPYTPTPTPPPTPIEKPEPKFFKRSGTLIAPNNDVVLLSMNKE